MNERIKSIGVNINSQSIKIPKLKGVTKIELFNEQGDKVQETIEENLITNAIEDCLNPPVELMASGLDLNDSSSGGYTDNPLFLDQLLPIQERFFNSVLLINEKLEENPDNYFPSAETIFNNITGYASDDGVYDIDKKGILNILQTKAIDNGYRYVWDFGLEKANGTIQTICLTPRNFGGKYNEHTYHSDSRGWRYNYGFALQKINKMGETSESGYHRLFTFKVDKSTYSFFYLGNDFSLIGIDRDNGNIIKVKMLDNKSIGLFDTAQIFSSTVVKTEILWTNPDQVAVECCYYDNCLYIWSRAINNSEIILRKCPISESGKLDLSNITQTTNIRFLISQEDYPDWEIHAPSNSNYYNYSLYDPQENMWYVDTTSTSLNVTSGFLFKQINQEDGFYEYTLSFHVSTGYIGKRCFDERKYLLNFYNKTYMYHDYKTYSGQSVLLLLKQYNESEEKLSSIKFKEVSSLGYEGTLINGIFQSNTPVNALHSSFLKKSPYFLLCTNSSADINIYLTRTIPLYSTINVLSAPITKTDKQTMRITYEITQAE